MMHICQTSGKGGPKKKIEFDNCRIQDIPSSVSTPAASTCLPLPLWSRMMKHGNANRREGRPPCSPAYDRQTGKKRGRIKRWVEMDRM